MRRGRADGEVRGVGGEGERSGVEQRDLRRAHAWAASGLLDLQFYGALRGREFPDIESAALDLVVHGMRQRLSPHPFLDVATLPQDVRRSWRKQKARQVIDHLTGPDGVAAPAGPLAGDRPSYAREAMLAAAREVTASRPDPMPDWGAVRGGVPGRVPGRVSVIVPTHADCWFTTRAVEAVLATTGGRDVEVVLVDNGTPTHVALSLAAAFLGESRVRRVRLPRNLNFAGGSNLGFAHSTGELVVFLNNDTRVRDDWLARLLAPLVDPDVAGAQPLLLYDDDTIQAAGTVFLPDQQLPCHVLTGHPAADGRRVAGRRFSAVTAAALAMRAVDVAALEGFDTAYRNGFEDVDLCLRSLSLRPGGFRVVPDAIVTHHESKSPGRFDAVDANRAEFVRRWDGRLPAGDEGVLEELGFEPGPVSSDGATIPSPRPSVTGLLSRPPESLRWSIDLPSTAGHWGDSWGDTYFGEQLAEALRKLGQDVVLRRYGAHTAGPTHLDDVALAIRGRQRVEPVPGRVNVLWVISHPDDIAADELAGFDLVCAASAPWSRNVAARTGRDVVPLLQATAVDPAALAGVPLAQLPEPVFVGNTDNGRRRDIVHRALDEGVHPAVWGRGWEGLLPEGVWRGEHVSNGSLPTLYRRHGVVLADHWPDMARHGFVANRVFDALAAGARVVVDDVAGLVDVLPFEGVCVLGQDESVAEAVAGDPPSPEIVGMVASEHSFAARAADLLERVRALR